MFTDNLGIEYPVTELPVGAEVEGEFQDFRSRFHSLARTTVVADTDLHTAVFLSAV